MLVFRRLVFLALTFGALSGGHGVLCDDLVPDDLESWVLTVKISGSSDENPEKFIRKVRISNESKKGATYSVIESEVTDLPVTL